MKKKRVLREKKKIIEKIINKIITILKKNNIGWEKIRVESSIQKRLKRKKMLIIKISNILTHPKLRSASVVETFFVFLIR